MSSMSRAHFLWFVAAGTLVCASIVGGRLAPTAAAAEQGNTARAEAAIDANELRWDLARGFEFDWEAAEVSAKVLKGDVPDANGVMLTISMRVKILDATGWITIDVNRPGVFEVLDENGRPVDCQPSELLSVRRYEKNGWRWEGSTTYPPGTTEWYEGRLLIRLPVDTNQPMPSMLSQVMGYIYVLDGKIVKIDVPFEARDGKWVDFAATPDLLFRINPRTPAPPGPLAPVEDDLPIALYRYETYVKSQSGQLIMATGDVYRLPRDLYPFGDYALIRTELFDSQRQVVTPVFREYVLTTGPDGVAHCNGEKEQDENDYDMIRHVLVMGPADVKVPFVLTDIPIPSLPPTGE